MDKEPLNRRDWIAGLEKGLAILEAFDNDHPRLTPTQAAQLTGLTRTAARRYLLTLEHLGYTTSDGTLFSLTPRVLKVGWSYFDSARLPRAVQPFLQQITAAVGEPAYLSVLDAWELVFICRTGTSRVMNTGFVLGARVPAPLASAGVMMLASEPEDKVKAWLEDVVLTPYTPYTIMQQDRLLAEIRKAGAQGYALVEQQLQIGVRGVAVPLRDRHGKVIAALSVNMQIGEESAEQALERVLQVLQDTAISVMRVL
ncbi:MULTISPECIES: IclR family transcriptional regulator domain-containing protein [Cupriavidus]|uniref:IclR family transcriptional regulator domain-containing protein n=1 Tax=Cupriavidus TaxID=106589 RepID=UPI00044F180D|nr:MULTISPECIES: IclR family transcriptional regulator C-terminal domain-containing protein [Cupriavidus]KDP86448.1 4-hydroxyphenylpyruvate dioxygenase [Cupriavidus sp. SK-3]MDF3884725.1 IclR family transcriptional regulator C-terminal domain-containing protein [Cupriavidus basilensis]